MVNIQTQALELFARKNADYGDSFATYGIIGILIRIQDKIKRALSISSNGITLVEDESMADTLLDLHNYAAMALMLMEEGKSDRISSDSPVSEENPVNYINFIEIDGDSDYEGCEISRVVYDSDMTGYEDDGDISQVV